MKKKTVWIVLILVLAAAAGGWWWKNREPAPEWRTAPITRGPISVTVTATGSLQAVTTVQVGTQVSGTISALYADFNSRVTRGQVIARLDTTLLYAALQDARSGLERVAAQAQQAAAERERARNLSARDLISRAELENAEAASRVAAANQSSARAQVERAEINLRYAIIESPIDGIVLSRDVDPGQTVAASLSAPTLFVIAEDMRQMRVQAAVDEADIGRVREGQRATFTVDAYPDSVFAGTVEQVRLQPKVTQNVVTYDVILRAENPDLRLMPGMTANLTIVTERRDDVLRAPAAALRFAPPEGSWMEPVETSGSEDGGRREGRARGVGADASPESQGRLFALENGNPKAVRVRTGLSDGARVEIEGPLEPGTEVIVGTASTATRPAAGGAPFGMQQTRGLGGGGGRR